MSKVRGNVFFHEQGVALNLIKWLHGIRGKAGKNILQAFARNKGSHHRLINPINGDISVQEWYDDDDGGLIRSSVESYRKVAVAKGSVCSVSH